MDDGVFLEGTLADFVGSQSVGVSEDAVSFAETRGDGGGGTDFDDFAGDVFPEDGGVGQGESGHGLDFPVHGVDGYGGVFDDDFVFAGGSVRCGFDFERFLFFGGLPGCGVGRHGLVGSGEYFGDGEKSGLVDVHRKKD